MRLVLPLFVPNTQCPAYADIQRLPTELKTIHELLPSGKFLRANRSHIVNLDRIDSFSNNDVFMGSYEIGISDFYRDAFLEKLTGK